MKLTFKMFTHGGLPLDLEGADSVEVVFPYANNRTKRKTRGKGLEITGKNQCEVTLDDFEIDAMPENESVNVYAQVKKSGIVHDVLFKDAFAVIMKKGRKGIELK